MTGSRSPGTDGRKQDASRMVELIHGDCIEAMAGMASETVDAVVTDPPYGIDFQGERWDGRAIEEAVREGGRGRPGRAEAFELWARAWGEACLPVMRPGAHLVAFGSPRTFHRLVAGLEDAGFEIRDTLMWLYGSGMPKSRRYPGDRASALKPAFEPIVLARRPLLGTLTDNLALHGTGLLELAECRVGKRHPADVLVSHDPGCRSRHCVPECPRRAIDECAGRTRSRSGPRTPPSRFFYCPKASRPERDAGCEGLDARSLDLFPGAGRARRPRDARNPHPTVKPLELMRWLVRLICPPDGVVLDPFTGSGSTGAAAAIEGRGFRGIEREERYLEIATARIGHWAAFVDRPAEGPAGKAQDG